MSRRAELLRFARFAGVGVTNTLLTLVSYAVALRAHVPLAAAGGGAYLLGGLNGFVLNRRLTFAHRGPVARAAWRYGLVAAAGALVDVGLLHLAVGDLSVPRALGELAAVPPVTVATFLACRAWAFAPAAAPPSHAQTRPHRPRRARPRRPGARWALRRPSGRARTDAPGGVRRAPG